MEIKFDVYFKKNLGTLFKNNEVDLNGLPARTNLQLVLVDRLEINYKVGSNKYTDIVTITDSTENLIQIPFKSDVMKVGLNEFEIVAYMKNGDIKTSQTYTYNIDEAIGEGRQTGSGGSSDGHTHNNLNVLNSITQSKVSEWNNKADSAHSHSEYASKSHTHNASEIEGLENVNIDLSDYYTKSETYNKTEIDSKIANMGTGGNVDLSNYYTKSETDEVINNKADKVHTHSEYLTELPTHTHNEYLTEHQDISHKANKEDTYTKTQTDSKISEEIAKAQLGGGTSNINKNSILKNMKWCVIGDSISDTEGGRSRTTKFYQEYIQDETECILFNWGGNGTGYTKEFNGVSYISNRLDDIPQDSNLITIFAGTNDTVPLGNMGDNAISTFYGAVDLTVKAIIEKYPLVPLGLITPLPSGSSFNGNGKLVGYSKAIKEIGEKYSVPVLDLFSCSGFRLGSDDFVLNNIPDKLHPNANGHKILYKKIKPWLENMVLVDKISDVVIRGVVVFPQHEIKYNEGTTIELQVSLSRVPNENQGVVLSCSNSSISLSKTTLYFNKNNNTQTVTVTIPSGVTDNFTISGNTWGTVSTINFVNNNTPNSVSVQSVSLNKSAHAMEIDEEFQLIPTIVPLNATNTSVTWEVSNEKCTVVNGLVTAIEEGECTVTCKTVDGNKTDTCIITVRAKENNDSTDLPYLINLDFNDNSDKTKINDLASEGRKGTVSSASLVSWENGEMNHVCTGANQGITVSNLNISEVEELSFEIAIQSNNNNNATVLFSTGIAGDNISISFTPTGISCGLRAYDDGQNSWLPNLNAQLDVIQKNHMVLSVMSGNISLYVNGINVASNTNTFTNLSIKQIQAVNWNYNGTIDTLNVYQKALTCSEVEDVYRNWLSK